MVNVGNILKLCVVKYLNALRSLVVWMVTLSVAHLHTQNDAIGLNAVLKTQ